MAGEAAADLPPQSQSLSSNVNVNVNVNQDTGTQAAASSNAPTTRSSEEDVDVDVDVVMTTTTTTTTTAATVGGPAVGGGPVPLDSPLRTTPIHSLLSTVKMPAASASASASAANTNPITLQPFTEAELVRYGYEKLRAEIVGPASTNTEGVERERGGGSGTSAAQSGSGSGSGSGLSGRDQKDRLARLRDETATLLKQRLDEREKKAREIEREMEEKEKIREVERKVFRKRLDAMKKDG
ncbi:hypothetical protein H2202_005448 [Exophiala xenobiotica]|nr:hypothetical protein H2202_005448 [Exophiala xenobiotica]